MLDGGTLGNAGRRLLVGIGDRALDQDWFRIVCFVSCPVCFVHGISLVLLSCSVWYGCCVSFAYLARILLAKVLYCVGDTEGELHGVGKHCMMARKHAVGSTLGRTRRLRHPYLRVGNRPTYP